MKPYIEKELKVGDRMFRLVVNRAGNIAFAVVDMRTGKQEGNLITPEHALELSTMFTFVANQAKERVDAHKRQQAANVRPQPSATAEPKRGSRRGRGRRRK